MSSFGQIELTATPGVPVTGAAHLRGRHAVGALSPTAVGSPFTFFAFVGVLPYSAPIVIDRPAGLLPQSVESAGVGERRVQLVLEQFGPWVDG